MNKRYYLQALSSEWRSGKGVILFYPFLFTGLLTLLSWLDAKEEGDSLTLSEVLWGVPVLYAIILTLMLGLLLWSSLLDMATMTVQDMAPGNSAILPRRADALKLLLRLKRESPQVKETFTTFLKDAVATASWPFNPVPTKRLLAMSQKLHA